MNIGYSKEIYKNIYRLFKEYQNIDESIMKVHSVNIDDIKEKCLNVVFDYGSYRVQILVTDKPNIIINSTDELRDYIESKIINKYPQYKDVIK